MKPNCLTSKASVPLAVLQAIVVVDSNLVYKNQDSDGMFIDLEEVRNHEDFDDTVLEADARTLASILDNEPRTAGWREIEGLFLWPL